MTNWAELKEIDLRAILAKYPDSRVGERKKENDYTMTIPK